MKLKIFLPLLLSAALIVPGCAAAGKEPADVSQKSAFHSASMEAPMAVQLSGTAQSLAAAPKASANASGDAQSKNPLIGQWAVNAEASVDAIMNSAEAKLSGDDLAQFKANRSKLRKLAVEKLSAKDAVYQFDEGGTGKFLSETYGNGTIQWTADGKELKMKITDKDGQVFDKVTPYKFADGNLIFYSGDEMAVFSRPSALNTQQNPAPQKLPDYKMYANFPDVIDFGEYCTFVNKDATEAYTQGDARGYLYYVLRRNGDELKSIADYILAHTNAGYKITNSKTADDGFVYYLDNGKTEIGLLAVDASAYFMQVIVVMGNSPT